MSLSITRIDEKQLDTFLTLLKDIGIWLKDNGKEMWNLNGLEREEFLKNNQDAELFLCYLYEEPVGAFMLKEENEFWWPDSNREETLFLKKFGVHRSYGG